MRFQNKLLGVSLALLLISSPTYAKYDYDIRVERNEIYEKVRNYRKRLAIRYRNDVDLELKRLGSGATSQQKSDVIDRIKAKYMQKHSKLDSAMTSIARRREAVRTDILKKAFKKAKVPFPKFTGTPPSKTGGILTDIDLSTIPKKDAKKVYVVLKKMFGKANVSMVNGTISVPKLDTTAFYPMKGGKYAPYTYDNPEFMHYFDKHAPTGNATSQINVRKDYIYDNVKKMHNDLTVNAKKLLRNPDRLRNISKSAFRMHGTTGGAKSFASKGVAYKDSKKLLDSFKKSIANGKPMKLSTIDKALLISKEKLSAEAVGLYSPGAKEADKIKAINKYRDELKVLVKDSMDMATHFDETIESQLTRKYNKAVKKGKITKAKAIKKGMMELKARKIRAKLGIIRNGGSDMLAESMGLKSTGLTKTANGKVKTYYDPKTNKTINQAQLRQKIIQDDWDALNRMSKMDETFVAKQHMKNPKRKNLVKLTKPNTAGSATNTRIKKMVGDISNKVVDASKKAGAATKKLMAKSAEKMRKVGKKVVEKIAPQLQARAGFGKALGWVGFLAALPQSMKDSEELTKKWITENDTNTSVFAKQFASLSLHASGAKYMFDMFGNNVDAAEKEFRKQYPGAWENMSYQERREVRKQSFKSAIWKTSGQMAKGIIVDMPKAMAKNTYKAAIDGVELVGLKAGQYQDEKRMKQTQALVKQKKKQIAIRSANAQRDWQKLHAAYEKKHGKATEEYLKNPPKLVGDKDNPDYENLLDMAYGQEIADSLEKARQEYRDALKATGGKRGHPRVTDALRRISSLSGIMEDYLNDPRHARKSGKAKEDLAKYQEEINKANEDMLDAQNAGVGGSTKMGSNKGKPGVKKGSRKGITIVSAKYGKSKHCDATAALAGKCNGKYSCSIRVSNNLCGDPEYGIVKDLLYSYRCAGGGNVQSTIQEYKTAVLECQEPVKTSKPAKTSGGNGSKVKGKGFSDKVNRAFADYQKALQFYNSLPGNHPDKGKAKRSLDVKYKLYKQALISQ